ncbi:hypothetical protein J5N97_013532 [Dioscorea zingiberensis]|uniref:Uncharacterized protein n=1 Tax=Dioscorea zingiberensis TaxID=325984 RepID=A0A9D5CRD0_9LILI|nr:hypothetical protein J5N97_013532 [Dioscorea zingiberensis]
MATWAKRFLPFAHCGGEQCPPSSPPLAAIKARPAVEVTTSGLHPILQSFKKNQGGGGPSALSHARKDPERGTLECLFHTPQPPLSGERKDTAFESGHEQVEHPRREDRNLSHEIESISIEVDSNRASPQFPLSSFPSSIPYLRPSSPRLASPISGKTGGHQPPPSPASSRPRLPADGPCAPAIPAPAPPPPSCASTVAHQHCPPSPRRQRRAQARACLPSALFPSAHAALRQAAAARPGSALSLLARAPTTPAPAPPLQLARAAGKPPSRRPSVHLR